MHDARNLRYSPRIAFVFALASLTPSHGLADVTAAAKAFARGQAAQLEGNYAQAAEHFELAFALQPSKEALRSAARMQLSAKNFARAATHAEALLARFADDEPSAELARAILDQVASGLARYEVVCSPECALSVDRLAYFVEPANSHRLYLKPGRVLFEAHFANGLRASRSLTTNAGETTRVELRTPPAPLRAAAPVPPSRPSATPPTAHDSHSDSGLPVVVPWLTGAAAVACGGLTLWAALDTQRQHDDYLDHPTQQRWSDGVARQRLTNILAASSAALGVATVTLAFFVRGSTKPRVGVTPALGPSSAALKLDAKF